MAIVVRKLVAKDEIQWRELWDGYWTFYENLPAPDVTEYLWNRLIDPTTTVHGIVAVDDNEHIVGFANYIIHENTWTLTPVCYLQDLFVNSKVRSKGIGRTLMDWLISEMKKNNWSRIYWNTKENNYQARMLYDSYTPHSGFLRYAIKNDAI